MSRMTPNEMALTIGNGLLSFPVTPFDASNKFDAARYRSNLDWLCSHEVAGLFAAGGTGEFFSLTPAEVVDVVATAVQQTAGRVPVLAGVGYGTAMATELAGAVERAGADGILLLPPYLVPSEQAGLADHVEAVCTATSLGVIVYNRDNAILTEDTIARTLRALPEPCRLQGRRRRHRTDDAHPSAHGRPVDLCRRVAHRRDLRVCLPRNGRHRPLPSPCSISYRSSRPNSTRRCGGATESRPGRPARLHHAAARDPQPQARLCRPMIKAGMKVIGRRFRPGAVAANRPDVRGSRGTVCSSAG